MNWQSALINWRFEVQRYTPKLTRSPSRRPAVLRRGGKWCLGKWYYWVIRTVKTYLDNALSESTSTFLCLKTWLIRFHGTVCLISCGHVKESSRMSKACFYVMYHPNVAYKEQLGAVLIVCMEVINTGGSCCKLNNLCLGDSWTKLTYHREVCRWLP